MYSQFFLQNGLIPKAKRQALEQPAAFIVQRKFYLSASSTLLHPLQRLVCLDGLRRERVILPPRHQCRNARDARRDQLLHRLALDGQHGLAPRRSAAGWSVPAAGRPCVPRCRRDSRFRISIDVCFHISFLSALLPSAASKYPRLLPAPSGSVRPSAPRSR